jgi:iron-sulfur cluster repair protein YtfE (RIC family)
MFTQLGKPAAAGDAVGLLLECHERIRAFLALARRVAGSGAAEQAAISEAADRVRRYFTQALPLHAKDEEESILPRLRGLDRTVDHELEVMVREHAEHERPLRALVEACKVLGREPTRHADLAPQIATATEELERHFAGHLRREEEVIFPAVRRLLDRCSDSEIVKEIRARRGVVERPGSDASFGPIFAFLTADHLLLNALFSGAFTRPGQIDRRSFDDFREALLHHIAIEEKILLPAARDARAGEPLPGARRLRIEHGAIAALLEPSPTPEIAAEIRKILDPHNVVEEGEGGIYEACDALLGGQSEAILRRIREYPRVKVARYQNGPRVCRTAEEALRLSALQSGKRG